MVEAVLEDTQYNGGVEINLCFQMVMVFAIDDQKDVREMMLQGSVGGFAVRVDNGAVRRIVSAEEAVDQIEYSGIRKRKEPFEATVKNVFYFLHSIVSLPYIDYLIEGLLLFAGYHL